MPPSKRDTVMGRKTEQKHTAVLTNCGQNLTFANLTSTHERPLIALGAHVSEGLSIINLTVYPLLCIQHGI